MRKALANLVHPLLHHGLSLKDRLDRGEKLDFAVERAVLKGMLLTDGEGRPRADFSGDEEHRPGSAGESTATDSGSHRSDRFLGVRYALVCWLDELFVLESPWEQPWNEQKLEAELYGSNDRAWRFWEQARRAESRPEKDALEVFYLCVMLGFGGELREQPERLQTWAAAARAMIARVEGAESSSAVEPDPPTQVPPLRGREQLRRMVLAGGAFLLLLIPVVAFFVVRKLGQ
ncbi:MAG TPA: DotU family type IV/VI secretion system protein [Gemmataceae bacterium]|nr:DotU family type IV/VI secretion system protein [Gemmataceae bacterium]